MIIDFHSHILPGIDDGARNWDEFSAIARQAVEAGITHMVCTPHYIYKEADFEPEKYYKLFAEAKRILKELGLNIKLVPGSEVFYVPEVFSCLEKGLVVTINGGNKYILLEFPQFDIPNNVEQIIYLLKIQGVIPIIAHPERNPAFSDDPGLLDSLLKKGALAQLNAGSIVGESGKQVRKTAQSFIKAGMIHLLGSDVHTPKNPFQNFNKGLKKIEELLGTNKLNELLIFNPVRIIRGEKIGYC
ncbi:MAG: capsular biosynthesis protein [Clostridia bacterium]|nr:capsular biosynthesis protein [Clostridia bacterium]